MTERKSLEKTLTEENKLKLKVWDWLCDLLLKYPKYVSKRPVDMDAIELQEADTFLETAVEKETLRLAAKASP